MSDEYEHVGYAPLASPHVSSANKHAIRQMKLIQIIALVCALLVPLGSRAEIVSGIHYTDGGKLVNLQNLEWLSLNATRDLSRHEIEQGAGGYFASGWRYATRLETSLLLSSLWGGEHLGSSIDNGDGAEWFFWNIGKGNVQFGSAVLKNFFYGAKNECAIDDELSCLGIYGAAFSNVGLPTIGWFYDEYGLDASNPSPGTVSVMEQNHTFGSLLVRGNSAPEPNSLILSIFALILLCQVSLRKGHAT